MRFWIQRFTTVFVAAFLILLVVERLKHHPWSSAVAFSGLWALASTVVFITTRLYYIRKGQACAICKDMPEDTLQP